MKIIEAFGLDAILVLGENWGNVFSIEGIIVRVFRLNSLNPPVVLNKDYGCMFSMGIELSGLVGFIR